MAHDDRLMQELLATFHIEAAEHLETLNHALLELERLPDPAHQKALVQEAFRAAHSLKGAARAVNMKEVESVTHGVETILQRVRDHGFVLTADVCDVLYDALDTVTRLISAETKVDMAVVGRLLALVQAPVPAPATETEPNPHLERTSADLGMMLASDTIRVPVNKLDDLMAEVGELLVARIGFDQRATDSKSIQNTLKEMSKTWQNVLAASRHEHKADLSTAIQNHAEALERLVQAHRTLDQGLNQDAMRLKVVTGHLQDQVRRARMVPFQMLVLLLERVVRDVAHNEAKQVVFEVLGGSVELDKKVLEQLKDPLVHLLRNAVGHGLESTAARVAAGKPPEGHITIMVRQHGSEVRITVQDDGRGFDTDALRRTVTERGLEEREWDQESLINAAFLPGVSTAPTITTLAGRGIGLDVVRQAIEAIQGRIAVESEPGQGTTITLMAPTSVAITRGLLVQVGRERYILPLLAIEKIIPLTDSFTVGGRTMIRVDNTSLPLISLASALNRNAEVGDSPMVIILAVAEQRRALLVDDVLTEQEVTVKPLDYPLQRVRHVSGVAVLGSGEPIIVLNPADLVRSQTHNPVLPAREVAPEERPIVHVLVVDDSITTRTLEKNILEAAGYAVTTATDGVMALQRIKEKPFQIVVSDVQMPNMDGFTLARSLRSSQAYSNLPIILVTSLENQEDREQGMQAGANAYIVKRGFDQAELLATIQRLI